MKIKQFNISRRTFLGCLVLATLSVITSFVTRKIFDNLRYAQSSLVADNDYLRVRAEDDQVSKKDVVFELRNRSNNEILIKNISTSCNCVSSEKYDGLIIGKYGKCDLKFRVDLPQFGKSRTRILVSHTASNRPVELLVEAEGRYELPVLRTVVNGSPMFLALSSPTEQATVIVRTHEKPNSSPWLAELTCDLPEVKCEMSSRKEALQEASGILVREYNYIISWHRLPDVGEFSGSLIVSTRSNPIRDFAIGRVIGSLGNRQFLAPSVALLSRKNHGSEMISFAQGSGVWSFSQATSLPTWVSAEWKSQGKLQHLVVKLNIERLGSGMRKDVVELVSDTGNRAKLLIAVE